MSPWQLLDLLFVIKEMLNKAVINKKRITECNHYREEKNY